MPDSTPSPEFEEQLRSALQAPAPRPEFVAGLRSRLAAQPAPVLHASPGASSVVQQPGSEKPYVYMPLTNKPRRWRAWGVIAAVCMALAVIILLVSQSEIVQAAVRRIFGYAPGVGVVELNSARSLAQPVIVVREGITVTVEQAYIDVQRTVVVFQVQGLSIKTANQGGEAAPRPDDTPSLRLPDGTTLKLQDGGGDGWGSGYRMLAYFPPLPANIEQADLLLPYLLDMPEGGAPQDWQITLRFQPIPAGTVLAPVIVLDEPPSTSPTVAALNSTPMSVPVEATHSASPSANATQPTVSAYSSLQHGIRLNLEKIVPQADRLLLLGSITWDDMSYWVDNIYNPVQVSLTDGQGANILLEVADIPGGGESGGGRNEWGLEVIPAGHPGPWTLTLPSIQISKQTSASFDLDSGSQLTAGQSWEINRTIQVEGYPITILEARTSLVEDGTYHLDIDFRFEPPVAGAYLSEVHSFRGGTGVGNQPGVWTANIIYDSGFPTGILTIQIAEINIDLAGPWQITWEPPSEASQILATPLPAEKPCLTAERLHELAADGPDPQAAELPGWVLFNQSAGEFKAMIVRPDGSEQKLSLPYGHIALAPDGNRVVYMGEDGKLWIIDAASGETSPLTSGPGNDYAPFWSPDGEWIAFASSRTEFDLYVIRPDGSDLRQLTGTADYKYLLGWSPDSQQVVFTIEQADGLSILALDLVSGAQQKLLPYAKAPARPAFSPDGRRAAFIGDVFGQVEQGLYVSKLDGSEARLVVGGLLSPGTALWSPDSTWLVVNVFDPYSAANPYPRPVFIQPDTCQVILFPGFGDIVSWVEP